MPVLDNEGLNGVLNELSRVRKISSIKENQVEFYMNRYLWEHVWCGICEEAVEKVRLRDYPNSDVGNKDQFVVMSGERVSWLPPLSGVDNRNLWLKPDFAVAPWFLCELGGTGKEYNYVWDDSRAYYGGVNYHVLDGLA